DIFRLLEKDRSLYPAPNTGELSAAIGTGATSFTLSPTGIGDEEYPASFRCIIGDEGFDVTRSSDTCTITQRGLYKGLDDHEADDTVQIVGQLGPAQANQIAETIITTAQPDLSVWIPSSEWQAEADQYLPRLYSSDIVKPTGVNELLKQLMDSAPVMFWPNPKLRRIEMRAIKGPSPGVKTLTDRDHYKNLEKKDRPKDRLDAALVWFGLIEVTGDRDQKANYLQGVFNPSGTNYNSTQVREVFAPFISENNKAAANEMADLLVSRYKETPGTLRFELDAKHSDIWTGTVYQSNSEKEQDKTGANKLRNYLVVEAHETEPGHRIEYEAESYDWWIDETNDTDVAAVIISSNSLNINLRDVYDSLYANVRDNIEFIIESGVVVGSASTAQYSFESGDWPEAPSILVKNSGIIGGKPGNGGKGGSFSCAGSGTAYDGDQGEDGGSAINITYPLEFDNTNGVIAAGPGGGGGGAALKYDNWVSSPIGETGGGGGGGRGYDTGQGGDAGSDTSCSYTSNGQDGQDGTIDAPGDGGLGSSISSQNGGKGGEGGDWAQDGQAGQSTSDASGGLGGAAGIAINGMANITWIDMGTIHGTTQ
ncbi:MAG: hypothetical protein SV201_11690, partial [Pseudomonadota bacterium]|nr:hypothetical protein [Pseudomonadota bacterium]